MKVAFSGSRHHEIAPGVIAGCVRPGTTVLVGDCPTGVDKSVRDWCKAHGTEPIVYRGRDSIPWPGKGPERNGRMIRDADRLIAFWDGRTERCGTFDAIKQACREGVKMYIHPVGRGALAQ